MRHGEGNQGRHAPKSPPDIERGLNLAAIVLGDAGTTDRTDRPTPADLEASVIGQPGRSRPPDLHRSRIVLAVEEAAADAVAGENRTGNGLQLEAFSAG
jgi:hypothetical protein